MDIKESARLIANHFVIGISSHWALLFFFTLILIWLGVGFWLGFSETWQFVLHIVLAIVTFLMVLLIQHVQHRETRSMQIKLDELLKGVEGARNAYINIQTKPDDHLDKLQNEFADIKPTEQEKIVGGNLTGESAKELISDESVKMPVKIKTFRMSE